MATANKHKTDNSKKIANLTDSERQIVLYQNVVNQLDVGIHVIDQNGTTILYNDKMAALESMEKSDMLGKKLLQTMPYLKTESSTLLTVLHTGQPLHDRQQTYTNANGKQISTVNSTIPLLIEGKVFGALEIAKDITFIKSLAEKVVDLQGSLHTRKKKADISKHPNTRYTLKDILGQGEALQIAVCYARQAAHTASNVLVSGETGTGKELFAQSIHNLSPRKDKPFVAINCAALPGQLLEGLLFGTAKGGFTGAIDRPGLFEQANGGTVLLDEINSMELDLQAKLLRVIQESSVRRLGASNEINIDVRIIATMNTTPATAIAQQKLREDLYYRLSVVTIQIPPLCEHKEDIDLYIAAFIEKYNAQMRLNVCGVDAELRRAFYAYKWPGNVRELQHVIEGAMNLMADRTVIGFKQLPMLFRDKLPRVAATLQVENMNLDAKNWDLNKHLNTLEQNMIIAILQQTRGNISESARLLKLTRQALQHKIKKYNLK
ncbi:MAG: modulated sigma54 specific transcriptional regulator, Fis family [Firmicutes bacterium]|nr:modulated sigma54 specific transcriptional regulator, Fis family [Bacillota bacterium]